MRDVDPSGPPGSNESKVIIYRTSAFGGAVTQPVYDKEKLVGFTEKGNYFEVRCTPGEHLFISWGEYDAAVDADLAPGKTYFIKSYPKMGVFTAGAGLKPVTADQKEWATVEDTLKKMRCRELIPELAAQYSENRKETAEEVSKRYEEGKKDAKPLRATDGK
jgi:hypothetical protein